MGSAAKMTTALVGTKRARATIPAPAYVTVLRCSLAMISVDVTVPMSAVTIATVPKAGSALWIQTVRLENALSVLRVTAKTVTSTSTATAILVTVSVPTNAVMIVIAPESIVA
mmetsp:Transcript_19771/g.35910  ORF Transcript_19771/g.35910 Transcript_19771/m.35910 type:complete len:113 (-) Transcript_19771:117-455(-)